MAKSPLKLGYSVYDLSNPAFQEWEAGVRAGAEEGGAELIVADQKSSEATQVSGSADLINQGISGLIVTPVQPAALPQTIDLAHQNQIPVVIGDIGVAGSYDAYVVSDSVEAGRQAANYIIEQLTSSSEPPYEVAIIELHAGSVVGEDRDAGFEEVMAANGDFTIVASVDGNDTVEGGYTAAKDILAANPDVKAIFGTNGGTALGASRAVLESGRSIGQDGVVIIGIDGTQQELDAIADGTLSATIGQDFYGLGRLAALTALQLLEGDSPAWDDIDAKTILFPTQVVTADNLEAYLEAKNNR
ncbi:substrate-binding domain-containing protein [Demequina sp. NBRC 110052]|uniref:substrate-binding domain-containing protein n=1 Tax=Demequina sp. NBRC 110052 TaxID=1570341 RepID=UPI00135669A4|nr:substrate-binding domain-containing protein [Demequina sp. NBRC 110052]